MVDYVSQELYLAMEQFTFVRSELQAMLLEALKNFIQVFQVCSKIWGVDNNIVKVHQQGLCYLATKTLLHQALKGCWGVTETKWHTWISNKPRQFSPCLVGLPQPTNNHGQGLKLKTTLPLSWNLVSLQFWGAEKHPCE